MKKYSLTRSSQLAHGDGHELNLLVPVEIGVSHDDAQQSDGVVVSGEDLVAGTVRDVGVVGLGQALQPLRITQLDGDDVLQELADGSSVAYVAGCGQQLRDAR